MTARFDAEREPHLGQISAPEHFQEIPPWKDSTA